jgi:hypothetical protein
MGHTYRHTGLYEGYIKYAVEMDSGAMVYIPSFIQIGSGILKLIKVGWGINRHIAWTFRKPTLFFFFSK